MMVSSTLALDEMTTTMIKEIQPDIIVSDSVAYWGKLAAMKNNIPYVCSTTTFAFNRYSSRYLNNSILDIFRFLKDMPAVNKQIRRLREAGYPVKSILDIVQNDNNTNTIVYTSKYYQPCAETFSDRYHFIGPSMRPITKTYEKTAEKTIYISMGTINQNRQFYNNCIQALGKRDFQVIVSMGANNEHYDNLPDNIEIYDTVDQIAVLSITDAFITHCGMNSVSEALYYEAPLVLFPQTSEQGAVAKRTAELKAGVMLKSISEVDITAAIDEVLYEPTYANNARKISQSFHESGGVDEAVDFLVRIAKKNPD